MFVLQDIYGETDQGLKRSDGKDMTLDEDECKKLLLMWLDHYIYAEIASDENEERPDNMIVRQADTEEAADEEN